MNIQLYDKKTAYVDAMTGNGLYVLDPITITADTTEDIYGNYELNIEIELKGDVPQQLYKMLQVDNIIKVNDEGVTQLFRIAQAETGLDTINLYCRHITISDSLNLWLGNVKPTELNGQDALNWLRSKTVPTCNILFTSNIKKVNTADYVRKNLFDAITDKDNGFLARWGGEVKREGFTIHIDEKIGTDKSKTIIVKEGLNLVEFKGETDIDDLATVIYPLGFDGLQGGRVESPLIANYSMEFPKEYKYEDVKVRELKEDGSYTEGYETIEIAQQVLKERAKKEFEVNNVDKLAFECDVDFLDLAKFEEYKDLAQLEQANLGDYISVYVDTFSLSLKARVVKRVYDVLRQKRVSSVISTTDKLKRPVNVADLVDKELGAFKDEVNNKVDNMEVGGYNYILNSNKCLIWNENNYKQLNFELEEGVKTLQHLRGKNIVLSFDVEGEANFTEAGLVFSYEIEGEHARTMECKAKLERDHQGRQRLVAKFTLH